MGALKDIVDLTKDLESRAKDRRDMEIIHKIQSLAFSFQSNYADMVERDVQLVQENAELKKKLAEAQAEEVRIHRSIEFRKGPRTGNRWAAFCPKCHMPADTPSLGVYIECTAQCGWTSSVKHLEFSRVLAELG
ncbi:hypothetical protein Oter_3776 [Opitutus terrae PB90-1]|uniref:Uncharacterized protein n=2 Tax=Opitutus terrae TaxID=107709 RepID=B1ZYF3_OPITP|nr:hypothetical protein Oter_3776 [Opitutus terrae PB90-1]